MKLELDLENSDILTLKHVKCLIDNRLMKLGCEYEDLPAELVKPLDIMEKLEFQMGSIIPLTDFEEEMEKYGLTRKEAVKAIGDLKKKGIIFELKRGFIRRI